MLKYIGSFFNPLSGSTHLMGNLSSRNNNNNIQVRNSVLHASAKHALDTLKIQPTAGSP